MLSILVFSWIGLVQRERCSSHWLSNDEKRFCVDPSSDPKRFQSYKVQNRGRTLKHALRDKSKRLRCVSVL